MCPESDDHRRYMRDSWFYQLYKDKSLTEGCNAAVKTREDAKSVTRKHIFFSGY